MLTAEHLRSILSYDPATGRFRWLWDVNKKPNINSRDTKKVAGTINQNGRRYIRINGKGRLCSRLAWLYVYGDWPPGEIDHINGRTADDRIANLRSCSRSENQHNVSLTARNTSGCKGVHWAKRYQRWQAEIRIAGRKIYLGRFDDLDEAGAAYAAAARLHHGEFVRMGFRAMAETQPIDSNMSVPGIGHNLPPLSEQLVEEVAPFRARETAMLEVARRAVIVDDESAAKVNDLSLQLKALEDEIKHACGVQLAPYLDACRLIHQHYDPLIRELDAAYGDRTTGLRGMMTAYVRRRETEAEAERTRLAAEQRQREEEADAAIERLAAARTAGKGIVGAELAALKAEEALDAAQQRAEAVRPVPIRSTLGQVSSVRTIAFDIENLRQLLGWAMRQPMLRVIEADARKWIGAYLRQLGVDAVERGVEIPGVRSWIERSAGSRR